MGVIWNRRTTMPNKFIYDVVNDINNVFVETRSTHTPIEDRMDHIAVSQVFSFWREVQDVLREGAEEIRTLKIKVSELEKHD